MCRTKEWDFLLEELLVNATKNFNATDQYRLLQEKLLQMEQDCKTIFTTDQQKFANDCFEALMDFFAQQERHLYHQGMLDCVFILKKLSILI